MKPSLLIFAGLMAFLLPLGQKVAGQEVPFAEIPDYPETYSGGNVVVRMLDGMGFRYRWATEGLKEEDAGYRPSADARTIQEVMQHIYGLSEIIANAARKIPNDRREAQKFPVEIQELRAKTLQNMRVARTIIAGAGNLEEYPLLFLTNRGQGEYPFWHQINGTIEDAVWHSGQLAMMRRAAGNPMPEGVDFFQGTYKK